MWIKGFDSLVYSTRFSTAENGLFAFDRESGTHQVVTPPDGGRFGPYGDAFEAFGRIVVPGRVTDATGASQYGTELWALDGTGGVVLLSDIRQGPESSFPQVFTRVEFDELPGVFLIEGRFDSTVYEVIDVRKDGSALPFSDYLSGIDEVRQLRSAVSYEGQTVFLASIDGGPVVPWQYDLEAHSFDFLTQFSETVTSFSFMRLMAIEDRLFATIQTGAYGRELWELNDRDEWELISDVSPGFRSSSPIYDFTFNDAHYFTAVEDVYGRELYRLDDTEGLVRVSDIAEGPRNSIFGRNSHVFGDYVYFSSESELPGLLLHRMNAEEDIELVADSIYYPRHFAELGGTLFFTGNESLENGDLTKSLYQIDHQHVLSEVPLPVQGYVPTFELLNGTIYVPIVEDQGGFSVWAMTGAQDWHLLRRAEDVSGVIPRTAFTQPLDADALRDVYLGDDLDEVILAPDTGSLVYARGGDDVIHGGALEDYLRAGDGADLIDAGAGNDTLFGDAGNDRLLGGAGADAIDGGEGIDRAQYSDATAGILADLGAAGQNTGIAAGDSYVSIEDLYGSRFADTLRGDAAANAVWGDAGDDALHGLGGDDWLSGMTGADMLFGQSGDDTLIGGADDDILLGGAGADVLQGGAGHDRAQYFDADTRVLVDLLHNGLNLGIAAGDSYVSVEHLYGSVFADVLRGDAEANAIWGDSGDDRLFGRGGDDVLYGMFGQDVLFGQSGDDTLIGGAQDDVLLGGAGADAMRGGAGMDRADYGDASAGVFADLLLETRNTGIAAGDSYVSIEELSGSDFADTLIGDTGDNVLWGQNGDDRLYGRTGDDTLIGMSGEDVLFGQRGDDALTGGDGADIFVFQNRFGADVITDFEVALAGERIDLGAVTTLSDFADLSADHLSQSGTDVVIDDGQGNTITLLAVTVADLTADHFLF